jgi:molecular chaperone DnaK
MFQIRGSDFSDGIIVKGADLICEYDILDSGNIILDVTVPSIGGSFNSGRNFYSRQEGQIDYTKASKRLDEEAERLGDRLEQTASKVDDPRLEQARERLERAAASTRNEGEPETAKKAMDDIQEAKKLLAQTRKEHLKAIRQIELDRIVAFFNDGIREYARPAEVSSFDNLVRTAQRSIENNSREFEAHLDELRGKGFEILWRQDWFVIDRFKWLSEDSFLFPDANQHSRLCNLGREALQAGDVDKLREVVAQLESTRVGTAGEDEMIANANILVG